MEWQYLLIATAVFFAVSLVAALVTIKRLMIVVMPNELVILVGRRYRAPDGRVLSYRVLTGGRAIRIPFIEKVVRMSRGPYNSELDMQGVLALHAVRLIVQGPLEIKISGDPVEMNNAIERFMDLPQADITHIAMETLKGHIRAVLTNMESEQAVHDPLCVQQAIKQESESDFSKLGLVLETFQPIVRLQHPEPAKSEPAAPPSQQLLAQLADGDLSAEAKQAAAEAMVDTQFTLEIEVERTAPPSPEDLPEDYLAGLSVYGLAPNGLKVEVVYPAKHRAEVELMEGGGLKIPVLVRVLHWNGPHQRLVVLAI